MADFTALGGVARIYSEGVSSNTRGEVVTAAVGTNTKGSYVELVASTARPATGIRVYIRQVTSSVLGSGVMADIAIGGAGSEVVIIENLKINLGQQAGDGIYAWFLPINIPEGVRISAAVQSSETIQDVSIFVQLFDSSFRTGSMGSKVIAIGDDTATTNGSIIDPGASQNTKGAYTEINASTSVDLYGFNYSLGTNLSASTGGNLGFLVDIAVGSAGNEEVIVGDIGMCINNREQNSYNSFYSDIAIPSGSRISARAQSSTNNDPQRLFDIIIHGVI
jgi:hypothetical protein